MQKIKAIIFCVCARLVNFIFIDLFDLRIKLEKSTVVL